MTLDDLPAAADARQVRSSTRGRDEDDLEQMIADRVQRQHVLYQHGKQVQIVLLEAALRTQVVSPAALAGQLDRLATVAGLSTVELGIIPFTAQVPIFPLSGFRLYGDLQKKGDR